MSIADELEAELGSGGKARSGPAPHARDFGESVFTVANAIPTPQLLDRLGIEHDHKFCACPGCGEPKALLCGAGGTKCMHARCANVGPAGKPGYRTNVDIVAEREHVEPHEAARVLCGWFGVDVPAKNNGAATMPPDEPWNPTDDDAPNAPPRNAEPTAAPPVKCAATIASVLEAWRADGPLVHEPTGIARLDELTGGGPVYGTRWYWLGAPDAGKTAAVCAEIAHVYARRGIPVGLLAVDEEPGDLVTRFAQRAGYSRHHCEARDPSVLGEMRAALEDLPVRFYDDAWTIEAASADLAGYAKALGAPGAFLGIDSIQTVRCSAELTAEREMSEVAAITARVRAIRASATAHRQIVFATSELNRGAYANPDPSKQTSALAGAKWSGAIEYSARVAVCLRNVPGESDLLDLEIVKNKHGPSARPGDASTGHVFLRIDRLAQTLSGVSYEPPPDDREARRSEAGHAQVAADADTAERIIAAEPGIGARALRSAMRAAMGSCSDARADAAVRHLLANGRAHTEPAQPRQGQAVRHYAVVAP